MSNLLQLESLYLDLGDGRGRKACRTDPPIFPAPICHCAFRATDLVQHRGWDVYFKHVYFTCCRQLARLKNAACNNGIWFYFVDFQKLGQWKGGTASGKLLSAAERRGTPVLHSASVSDNSSNSPQMAAPRRSREIDQSMQRFHLGCDNRCLLGV